MRKLHYFLICLILFSGAATDNSRVYSAPDVNAAKIAGQILSDYLKQSIKTENEEKYSITMSIIDQHGKPGEGKRVACNMDFNIYQRKPHPHSGQFNFIRGLPDQWKFKLEHNQFVCERKFGDNSNELIRIKAHYGLPQERAKIKILTTMAFVDFYAGADQSAYFSFSINRTYPVDKETSPELEKMGFAYAVADGEKIVAAIRAGIAGKAQEKPKVVETQQKIPQVRVEPPPEELKPETRPETWNSYSPTAIIKTQQARKLPALCSPLFTNLNNFADLTQAEEIKDPGSERINCITAPDQLFAFTTQSPGSGRTIFLSCREKDAVILLQLENGEIGVSPIASFSAAIRECTMMIGKGLPTDWHGFSGAINPKEFYLLKVLGSMVFTDNRQPELPGFSLGQIMLESGNPMQIQSTSIFPGALADSIFLTTLNRNESGRALLNLEKMHLVKRTFIAGNYLFSLTSSGRKFTEMFAAGNTAIAIKAFRKENADSQLLKPERGQILVLAGKKEGMILYFSATGALFNTMKASESTSPASLIENAVKNWL